ncbi:MAG TPA: ATP-binding protein [Candidatus Saccharimonadia bacterium]
MAPTHRAVSLIVTVVTAIIIAIVTLVGLKYAPMPATQFVWRPIATLILVAMVAQLAVLWLLRERVRTRASAYYWLFGFAVVNLMWLFITLMQVLSLTPQAAAFWQGQSPLPAVLIPPTLFFFALSYLDDTDFPASFMLRLAPLLGTAVLLYFSAGANLVEPHEPLHSRLEYWGWQDNPGVLNPLVLLWGLSLMATGLVLLARRAQRLRDPAHRHQIGLFIAGLSVYFVGVGIDFGAGYLIPHGLPPLAFAYTTIMSAILMYGVTRYGLLRVGSVSQSGVVLENMAEAVIGITPQGHVEYSNTTAEIILGLSRDQLFGRLISGFFTPDVYHQLRDIMTGPAATDQLENAIILDQDRQPIPVSISITRLQETGAATAGYIMVIQNQTELRKKAQELEREKASVERKVVQRTRQLHDEQARLRASIEGLNLGFMLVDPRGRVLMQNQLLHKIIGINQEATTLAEVAATMHQHDLAAQCRQSTKEDRPIEVTDVALGSKILRIFTGPVHVLKNDDIASIGTVVLLEDITEAKVLERSRDEFFSIASHELRTPLTAIKGNTTMLMEYYPEAVKNPDVKDMVADIHDSSVRLIDIVNDFLDLSRLEQGKMSFDQERIQLEPLIEKVAYEMKSVLREKHLSLKLDHLTLDELPPVLADPNRVKQVLYNLVGNAAIYTAKGGITVNAVVGPTAITVRVVDTGKGIPTASQKYLFHKFQQAGDSILTRDSTRGTGLGLYISKLMMEKMGGSIQLEKSRVGHGSTFSFTLPRADI